MTICEHCGKELLEHVTICPSCGAPVGEERTSSESSTQASIHAQHKTNPLPFDSLYEDYIPSSAPIYERNYAAHPPYQDYPLSQKATPTDPDMATSAAPAHSSYPATALSARIFNVNTNISLIIEVLLSLLMGIFGVGWLLIGETLTGVLLLIGSVIFYLPLLIISYVLAYFSFGLSILCTGPLAIAAVFLNAFMLNKILKRKRAATTMARPK
ncbi:MAG TPA: zinc-ribbon domain-containing protein [Ktedonobacteraceae bacterium]|nr:zinc-ribbon domain-containing protein [Ktedonobacteraceae bacterium]